MTTLKETWRFLKFEYTIALIKLQRILDRNPQLPEVGLLGAIIGFVVAAMIKG